MKDKIIQTVTFILFFAAVYIIMCRLPAMRIDSQLTGAAYIKANLVHNFAYKGAVSALCGAVAVYVCRRMMR